MSAPYLEYVLRAWMYVCLSLSPSLSVAFALCVSLFSVFLPLTPNTYNCCEAHRGQKVLLYLEVTYLEVLFVCVFVREFVSLFYLPPSTWQMLRRISKTNNAVLSNVSRSCSAHVCVSLSPSLSPSNYLTNAAKNIENEQYTCQRRIEKLFCGFKRHVPNHCIIVRKTRDEAF